MTWTSAEDIFVQSWSSWVFRAGLNSWQLDLFEYQVMPQNHLGQHDLMLYIMWFLWTAASGHAVCAIASHELLHYSSFNCTLTSFDPSPSLHFILAPLCLLFFFFSRSFCWKSSWLLYLITKKNDSRELLFIWGICSLGGMDWILCKDKAVRCWLFKRNQFKCFHFQRCGLLYL